jgi:hypothetical protein
LNRHVDAAWRHKMNTISSWRIKIIVKPTNAETKAVFLHELLHEFWTAWRNTHASISQLRNRSTK